MGKNETVSVIIPVYNVDSYLHEALDSVIHQTYENLEIIIIDDGSTEGSSKICDEYAARDQRISVIHQKNKGLSNARNVGLDRMTGEIVAFLDSDDACDLTFIEELKSAMDREQADLALCKYTIHYTTGKMRRGKREKPEPQIHTGIYNRIDMLRALSDGRVNVSVWNKLYRRKLWEGIRFLDGHVFEDGENAYKIMNRAQKTVVINETLYLHRKRPGSITNTMSWANLHDQMLASPRIESFVQNNCSDVFSDEEIRKAGATRINSMIVAYTRLFKVRENIDKKTEGEKQRQHIIKAVEVFGMDGCKIRTRVAYQMVRRYPQFLRIAYPVYRPIRILIYKLIGR